MSVHILDPSLSVHVCILAHNYNSCLFYGEVNGFVRISTAYIYFLSAMVDIERKKDTVLSTFTYTSQL